MKWIDYGTHPLGSGSVTREADGWWAVEHHGVRERGCDIGHEYRRSIGLFSEAAALLLASLLGGRAERQPDYQRNGRCWLVTGSLPVASEGLHVEDEYPYA